MGRWDSTIILGSVMDKMICYGIFSRITGYETGIHLGTTTIQIDYDILSEDFGFTCSVYAPRYVTFHRSIVIKDIIWLDLGMDVKDQEKWLNEHGVFFEGE